MSGKNGINANALAQNKGFLFKYLRTVPAANFDQTWLEIFPDAGGIASPFSKNEVSGMMMITDDDALTKVLVYEEFDGDLMRVITNTVRTGMPLPLQARRILSAGTTALSVLVWLGQ